VCGDVLVLSAIVSVAVSEPSTDGVNETAMVQLAPIASEVPQLLLVQKSREFVPLREMLEIAMGPVPAFDRRMGCEGVVVPIVCASKAKLEGDSRAEPVPVPPPPDPDPPFPSRVQVFGAVQPNRLEPAAAALLKNSWPTWQLAGSDVPTATGRVNGSLEKSAL
jgi:hypothetical protein